MREQTVAVLGASAGLGAALACHHVRQGDRVIAIARRGDRLSELASVLGAAGSERWQQEALDLTRPSDLDELVLKLRLRAPLSAVYFVAAANEVDRSGAPSARLAAIEAYHRLLFGAWVAIAEAAIEAGLVQAGGAFVVISSIAAAVPFADLELYGAGKAALEAWARAGRRGAHARRVVVRPGRFDSEFFGARELDVARLPHALAARIARGVQQGRDEIHLGGLRDRMASHVGLAAQRIGAHWVRDASPARSDR